MTYALVVGDTIQAVGPLPESARRLDSGNWVMGIRDAPTELQRACGYFAVARVDRPADTATTTWERSVVLVAGLPTETWTERAKTQGEIDAQAAETNQRAAITAVRNSMANLDAVIADMDAYLALTSTTNAVVAAQVKDLCQAVRAMARNQRRLIRLVTQDLVSGAE
jgi:creatinine amidohydrolase/Fe(II)-dependent formamide hydrolase-like protein